MAHVKVTLGRSAKDCSVMVDGKSLKVRKLTVKAEAGCFTIAEVELLADEFELMNDFPITIYPKKDLVESKSAERLQSIKV